MQLSSLVLWLRPTAAVMLLLLLPLLLIGQAQWAAGHPVDRELSPPLRSPETYQAVANVSQHAQRAESAEATDDTSVRLVPRFSSTQDHLKICCLHGNILQFYLDNILPHHSNQNAHIQRLKDDLSRISDDLRRVSDDLQADVCNVTQHRHHPHVKEFISKFDTAGERRFVKAVAEIDILFSELQYYCVHTRRGR